MDDMDRTQLINQLSPPLDLQLTESLLQEFVAMERRYVLADWEPATLDGGQLAEIASRIIYHIDSGNLNRRKGVDACLRYIEDENNSNSHNFPKRRTSLHLARVLRTVYKFRSQRGAVHIDPDYSANELDAGMVMSNVRWIFSEILRVFWSGSTADVARAIREIIRFEVPAVLQFDSQQLVLRTDCTVEEEILILLHNAGEDGLSRSIIGKSIPKSASAITNALRGLASANFREVILRADKTYILTPNGTKRIREELSHKLTLL